MDGVCRALSTIAIPSLETVGATPQRFFLPSCPPQCAAPSLIATGRLAATRLPAEFSVALAVKVEHAGTVQRAWPDIDGTLLRTQCGEYQSVAACRARLDETH